MAASSRNPNLGSLAISSENPESESWEKNLGKSKLKLDFPKDSSWWTGLAPSGCPGFDSKGKLRSLLMPDLDKCTRQDLIDYFNNGWTLTELLFSGLLSDEAFYRPPYHALRHPLIFYYVHPAVLYVNKLRVSGLLESGLNSYFESLFETGVDEMSWDDMSKNVIMWPSLDEAHAYRKQVYRTVLSIIESHPGFADGHEGIRQENPLWALFMGFEHERIHLETSSVLIRELPLHLLHRPPEWPELPELQANEASQETPGSYPENSFVKVAATTVEYGKPQDYPSYGWDNEYGTRKASLSEFKTSKYLISNGEFFHFVADGGYHEKEYWSELGWRWRSFRNIKWPSFWISSGPAGSNQFELRTTFKRIPMQWSWPVLVNYHEAKAYSKWKSIKEKKNFRMLTEAEHHALRSMCGFSNITDNGHSLSEPYNINLRYGSERAVDGTLQAGIGDLFGNVWQWLEDHFNPLAGFKIHKYYDDFSTPCYDGQHQMIIGGSFISTGDEASAYARFHFRPHFFQHAGFRLVECEESNNGAVFYIGDSSNASKPYESEHIFNEYMTLHYGSNKTQMPYDFGPDNAAAFPLRCAEFLSKWTKDLELPKASALDIGCAVGAASFKLAESFDHVTGVDLSERFIRAANTLKHKHELYFNSKVEGDLYESFVARVSADSAQKVEFRQADACSLPAEFVDFDAVLMANLLCRLPSPQSCLSRMWGPRGIVKIGGLLLIVSPYTWMEEFTPREVWLGGFIGENGGECLSEDGIKNLLSENFELLHQEDMPLIIREHRRKFQYIVSQAMLWQRKS